MRVIALAAVAHMLRSRRFYERVGTVAVALAAVGQIGQQNQASTRARLAAWDKRQVQRVERKAKAQGRAVKGTGQMMRSGVSGRMASMKDGT
jgi:hypothetical protein